MEKNNYPEHEKVRALEGKKELVQDFLDWLLDEKNFVLGQWRNDSTPEWPSLHSHSEPTGYSGDSGRATLMAEFFAIDLRKLEQEKRDMLEELRERNGL